MKICVCISGLPRSGIYGRDLKRNIDLLKHNFSTADFYFATWSGHEKTAKKYADELQIFDEPVIDYHPFIDIEPSIDNHKFLKVVNKAKTDSVFRETSRNQTKQILAHSYLFDTIEKKYDVVIRARYDTITYKDADFSKLVKESLDQNCAIGFATLHINDSFKRIERMTKNDTYHKCFLFDQLIIHPSNLLDTSYVYDLHRNKKLIAAEHGWWQVLSNSDSHICINGWANPDKSVLREFL